MRVLNDILVGIGVVIMMVFGIRLIYSSLAFKSNHNYLIDNGVRVNGIVVSKRLEPDPGGYGGYYSIEFRNSHQELITIEEIFDNDDIQLFKGDTVMVLYDQKDPDNVMLYDPEREYYVDKKSPIPGILGCIFIVGLTVLWIKVRLDSKK